jgi:hypothetical protein
VECSYRGHAGIVEESRHVPESTLRSREKVHCIMGVTSHRSKATGDGTGTPRRHRATGDSTAVECTLSLRPQPVSPRRTEPPPSVRRQARINRNSDPPIANIPFGCRPVRPWLCCDGTPSALCAGSLFPKSRWVAIRFAARCPGEASHLKKDTD